MGYPKNENGLCVLSVWDQESLHNVAEDVIIGLRYTRYRYDNEGNFIRHRFSEEELNAAMQTQMKNSTNDYLNFLENEQLHQLRFRDALHMPLEEIKEKYLKDVLPVARGILRKDTSDFGYFFVVSDEVPDSFLDDLLALRWKENLKLWTIQWDTEKAETDDLSDR